MSGRIPFRWGKNMLDPGRGTRQEPVEQDSRVSMTSIENNLYSFPTFPALSDIDTQVEIEVR